MHTDLAQLVQAGRGKAVSAPMHESINARARISSGWLIFISSAAYLGLIVLWSIQVPFNEAPDEVTHFFFPEYLVAFHSIPVLAKAGVQFIGSLSGSQYSTNSEWYIGSAFLHSIGGAITGVIGLSIVGPSKAFYGVRAFNWLMGAISAAALSGIAVKASGSAFYRAAIVIAALSIPQVTFIFSYFNHDALGFAAACVLLYLIEEVCRRPRPDSVLAVLISVGLGLLSLAKVYYWPVAVFVIARLALQFIHRGWSIGRNVRAASLSYLLFPGLLIAAPFHLWNWTQYGDFTGAAVNQRFHELHPDMTPQALNICFLACKHSWIEVDQLRSWLWTTFESFFGVFGYMSIRIPGPIYTWYLVPVCLLILVMMWLPPCLSRSRGWRYHEELLDAVLVLGLSIALVLVSIWNSQTYANQPQGRYLFASIPVLVTALLGQGPILTRERKLYDSARTTGMFAIGLSMLWLNIFALSNVLARTYGSVGSLKRTTGLALGIKTATPSPTALTVEFGESREIVGNIDRFEHNSTGHYVITGWAADPSSSRPVDVVLAFSGGQLLAAAIPNSVRIDVRNALGREGTERSGFQLEFEGDPNHLISYCDVQFFGTSASSGVSQFARLGTQCPNKSHQ